MAFSGSKMRQIREERGLTGPRLAELIEAKKQQVNHWELGASVPGGNNVERIARALGCKIDELFDSSDSKGVAA